MNCNSFDLEEEMGRSFNPVNYLPEGNVGSESPLLWGTEDRPINPMSSNILDTKLWFVSSEVFQNISCAQRLSGGTKKRKQSQLEISACKHGRKSFTNVIENSDCMHVELEEEAMSMSNECLPRLFCSEPEYSPTNLHCSRLSNQEERTHLRVVSDDSTSSRRAFLCT